MTNDQNVDHASQENSFSSASWVPNHAEYEEMSEPSGSNTSMGVRPWVAVHGWPSMGGRHGMDGLHGWPAMGGLP